MKKISKLISMLMVVCMLFTSVKLDVFANVTSQKYNNATSAKQISINHKYTKDMSNGQELWLKVPVKALIYQKSHIKVETSGISNEISIYFNQQKALKGITDASYKDKKSPLSYPLAWKENYYYVKIKAKSKGKLTYKVRSEEKEPTAPVYEDEFCSAEALAMSEPSLSSMLDGFRSIRNQLLNDSVMGKEIQDYYYDISKDLSFKILSDTSLRDELKTNVKTLIPLMNGMISYSKKDKTNYIITKNDILAIEAIKKEVKEYLSEQDILKGESIYQKLELDQYIGKNLETFVNEKLLEPSNTQVSQAYSEYIVTLAKEEDIQTKVKEVQQFLHENHIPVEIHARKSDTRKYILEVSGCDNEDMIVKLLEKSNYFEKVCVNYQVQLLSNDIQYDYQWYLDNDGQKIPHRTSNGKTKKIAGKKNSDVKYESMNQYLSKKKRSKVVVAVIDTGINYELADFSGCVNKKDAYNFINNSKDVMDDNNHGTHVSGIIAANSNNGYSMSGLSSYITILPIKVLDAKGSGNSEDLAKAIKYAADHGANVINLSLGIRKNNGDPVLPSECSEVEEAMKYAKKKNITIVVAAGNESKNNLSYPANSQYTISVGAINNKDKLASFSNTGKELDVVAPGVAIASLLKNGEVAILDGTSMATPIVSAIVGNMYSLDKNLNSTIVREILKESCRDLGTKGYDKKYGYGCINGEKAVKNVAKKVKTISLSQRTKTLTKGKSFTLKVTIQPTDAIYQKVKWTSSNPKIAKVDSKGKVTALRKGTTTIKATTLDGSKKSISCKVTVKN